MEGSRGGDTGAVGRGDGALTVALPAFLLEEGLLLDVCLPGLGGGADSEGAVGFLTAVGAEAALGAAGFAAVEDCSERAAGALAGLG